MSNNHMVIVVFAFVIATTINTYTIYRGAGGGGRAQGRKWRRCKLGWSWRSMWVSELVVVSGYYA